MPQYTRNPRWNPEGIPKPADLLGEVGIPKKLSKALIERALEGADPPPGRWATIFKQEEIIVESSENVKYNKNSNPVKAWGWGGWGDGRWEMGRWADGEMGRWGELGEMGEMGRMEIAAPRDRQGEFEPQNHRGLRKKVKCRFDGFDERIISMSKGGMTVRENPGRFRRRFRGDLWCRCLVRKLIRISFVMSKSRKQKRGKIGL